MAEDSVTGDYYRRIAAARKPVFSIGTLAMAVTMVAAIMGASVDTRRAAADRPRDDRLRRRSPATCRGRRSRSTRSSNPAASSTRSTACSARDQPVLELAGVSKDYRGLRPLRIAAADASRPASTSRSSASTSRRPKCSSTWSPARRCPTRGAGQRVRPRRRPRSPTAPTGSPPSIASASSASARCCSTALTVIQNLAMPFTLDIEPPPTRCGIARPSDGPGSGAAGSGVDAAGRASSTPRDAARPARRARWRSIRRCCCSSIASAAVDRGSVAALGADIAAVAAARGAALVAVTADDGVCRARSRREF